MKRALMIAFMTVVSLGSSPTAGVAAPLKLKGGVFSPEAGVLCDKDIFCADEQGISMALTKMYLGEKAQKKLLEMGEFDTTIFTLTNGVRCEAKTRKCTISKLDNKVDAAHTRALFGN